MIKVHQELRLGPLTPSQEDEFISRADERLPEGWSRDRSREEELNRGSSAKFYCFACTQNGELKAARLFLVHPAAPSESLLYVSNIVPKDVGQLTYDEYNSVLRAFHDRIAQPLADSLGINIELTPPQQTVENWLGPDSAQLLRAFSDLANKSTGSSHPLDRRRWCDFLISLHRAREIPDLGLIERWLVEEEHWPEDAASDLVRDIEFAHDLLNSFDGQ